MPKKKRPLKIIERKLGREECRGLCWFDKKMIEIDPRLEPKDRLFTLIHESLHWAFPELSETAILKAERKIGKIIWEQNYRRILQ